MDHILVDRRYQMIFSLFRTSLHPLFHNHLLLCPFLIPSLLNQHSTLLFYNTSQPNITPTSILSKGNLPILIPQHHAPGYSGKQESTPTTGLKISLLSTMCITFILHHSTHHFCYPLHPTLIIKPKLISTAHICQVLNNPNNCYP